MTFLYPLKGLIAPVKNNNCKTIVISAYKGCLDDMSMKACLTALSNSGLLIIPTDTVYGIACNAFDPVAIKKVYALKGRDYAKPLPILLSTPEQLPLVATDIPSEAEKLISAYWPGPLTLVFKTAPIASHASHGKPTIAVRVPDHGVVRHLLDQSNLPLATTSANLSGQDSLTSGESVIAEFSGKVDVIVDSGPCPHGQPSSVVDASQYPFTILRQGVLSKRELSEKLHS